MKRAFLLIFCLCFFAGVSGQSMKIHLENMVDSTKLSDIDSITFSPDDNPLPTKLMVVWSSADPDIANKVCFMYTDNAKINNWFDEIRLIVWGPSAKLLTEDTGLQDYVKSMIEKGIIVEASKACADVYNIAQALEGYGINVRDDMAEAMSNYIKGDYEVLTY